MARTPPSTGRLLAPSRHDAILRRIASEGSASIADLSREIQVSRETIRRDLKHLADHGKLDIVHGGAAQRFEASEPRLSERAGENAAGKAAIGRAAAEHVADGMVVFLDSGTTTLAVADALSVRKNLTICTTSLAIAAQMCRMPGARVYLPGGEVDAGEEATTGIDVVAALARYRIDIAFLGAGGLSPRGEVTDFTLAGAEQRSSVITAAEAAYFVIDSSKFGRRTPLRIPNFEAARGVIVDIAPPQAVARALERSGIALVVGSP